MISMGVDPSVVIVAYTVSVSPRVIVRSCRAGAAIVVSSYHIQSGWLDATNLQKSRNSSTERVPRIMLIFLWTNWILSLV